MLRLPESVFCNPVEKHWRAVLVNHKSERILPELGLELTTFRLWVCASTNWAKSPDISLLSTIYHIVKHMTSKMMIYDYMYTVCHCCPDGCNCDQTFWRWNINISDSRWHPHQHGGRWETGRYPIDHKMNQTKWFSIHFSWLISRYLIHFLRLQWNIIFYIRTTAVWKS